MQKVCGPLILITVDVARQLIATSYSRHLKRRVLDNSQRVGQLVRNRVVPLCPVSVALPGPCPDSSLRGEGSSPSRGGRSMPAGKEIFFKFSPPGFHSDVRAGQASMSATCIPNPLHQHSGRTFMASWTQWYRANSLSIHCLQPQIETG